MRDPVSTSANSYIKASKAARLVGYSSDHVSRLARAGDIRAEKRGRLWYVDLESLKLFSLNIESEKRERREEIRNDRLFERTMAARKQSEASVAAQIGHSRQQAISQTLVLSIALFLCLNLLWFALESRVRVTNLADGAQAVVTDIVDRLSFSVPPLISQFASFAFIDRDRNSITSQQEVMMDGAVRSNEEATFSGIVILEEEEVTQQITEVRESFSDEVEIEFDGDDTGVITPVFREREGDAYRFLLVPVNERTQ